MIMAPALLIFHLLHIIATAQAHGVPARSLHVLKGMSPRGVHQLVVWAKESPVGKDLAKVLRPRPIAFLLDLAQPLAISIQVFPGHELHELDLPLTLRGLRRGQQAGQAAVRIESLPSEAEVRHLALGHGLHGQVHSFMHVGITQDEGEVHHTGAFFHRRHGKVDDAFRRRAPIKPVLGRNAQKCTEMISGRLVEPLPTITGGHLLLANGAISKQVLLLKCQPSSSIKACGSLKPTPDNVLAKENSRFSPEYQGHTEALRPLLRARPSRSSRFSCFRCSSNTSHHPPTSHLDGLQLGTRLLVLRLGFNDLQQIGFRL